MVSPGIRHFVGCLLFLLACSTGIQAQSAGPKPAHNLAFDSLATRWDEGIPLGNGWLGALIWKKGSNLRMSLDRVDLWDDRPMPDIDNLRFSWVAEKVQLHQYDSVQRIGDRPYEANAAPTKIPGAALEFNIAAFGKVVSNKLDISNGLHEIRFANGVVMHNYVDATKEVGYFSFEQMQDSLFPLLLEPAYHVERKDANGNSVTGQGLGRLHYEKGSITTTNNQVRYHQPTWNGGYYEVLVQWQYFPGNRIIGQWTISNNKAAVLPKLKKHAKEPTNWPKHEQWWNDFWARSSVNLPDSVLDRQYALELYKFACVARSNTPPISLQAVWTADNGNLPPWKGDFHHDLNTQLSYWPGYTSNHLDLTASYTNWLWDVREENRRWTKQYFGTNGVNVPGVSTISGKAMGGWIQYAMSPTAVAWLSQHFYWQWKYSMDRKFLLEKCLPYFNDAESYLMEIRTLDSSGKYRHPLSSSPEYFDNQAKAWFGQFTNYDLALVKYFYSKYVDLLNAEGNRSVKEIFLDQQLYPDLNVNETGLTVAPGQTQTSSHRHHSPFMAIYPLTLLNPSAEKDKEIIDRSLAHIEQLGTRQWCGYSFSWLGCMYAYAQQADSAAAALRKFATNFCSPNSFHLNGDQKGGQYSSFTYRPFTLEGNFAFAQGIHEMLLQSHNDHIEVFPAIPTSWQNVSFNSLRTEGAFLVSASRTNGSLESVTVTATVAGNLQLKKPCNSYKVSGVKEAAITEENGILNITMKKGQTIRFQNTMM